MSVDRHRYRWRGITYPSLRLDGCVVRIDVGTILNIRNPRAHELAKELAERRKTGIQNQPVLTQAPRLESHAAPLARLLDERSSYLSGSSALATASSMSRTHIH